MILDSSDFSDFKEKVILLMQHPIMCKPIEELRDDEQREAFDLINSILSYTELDSFTRSDYIQRARLEFIHAELTYVMEELDLSMSYYRRALYDLQKGGFDLGIRKWAELLSFPTME